METIILLPGTLGSKLSLAGEEVWPPTLGEIFNGYQRLDKLRDPAAIATEILARYTIFKPIYKPIMNYVDDIASKLHGKSIHFPYDWRNDLWDNRANPHPAVATSELLAREVQKAVQNGATSISLVAHSMGGLVARLLLEGGRYNAAPWFKKIKKLVAVCTPHLGAPKAVGRALALEGPEFGLSALQQQTVINDPNFPAFYELFPAPGRGVLFDVSAPTRPLDIYSSSIGGRFGLTRSNQAAATKSWQALSISRRPSHVRYVFINGGGHSTPNQYFFTGTNFVGRTETSGDGTVPAWSSNPGGVEEYTLRGEHIDVMFTTAFAERLYSVFGVTMMIAARVPAQPGLTISMGKTTFVPEEAMEILLVPDLPSTRIQGVLQIGAVRSAASMAEEQDVVLVPTGGEIPLNYEGPAASSIPIKILAPATPGLYTVKFEGSHSTGEQPCASFIITQDHIGRDVKIVSEPRTPARKRTKPRTKRSGGKRG